ncbi:MAG: tetratricopeptide repeat protein [Cyanobacteria bacterium P01_D01_bin.36]
MQFLGPVNDNPPHPSKVTAVSEATHAPISQPSVSQTSRSSASPSSTASSSVASSSVAAAASTEPAANTAPAKGAYHFRVDSWLSNADARLLLRKRAQREAKQQNYAAAIQIFNQLSAYEPNNADNFANRGLMHYNLKHYEQALADFDRALELNPELDKAYNNRANLHATQQNWLDALDDYDEAIDINPLNMRARLNQAITLREIGDYEEAIACLDIAMFFRPESANLYAERGRTYQLQGHWNCASSDYARALELTESTSEREARQPALGNAGQIKRKVVRWMNSLL